MSVHLQLLKQLADQRAKNPERGGFATAEAYVQRAIEETGGFGKFSSSQQKSALEHAATTLVVPGEVKAATAEDISAVLPDNELPPHTKMALIHKLTSNKEDRDKDVLHTSGAMLDPKAPLLWQHMHTMPVGKVVTTIEQTEALLRVASVLLDLNSTTEDAAKLIEADVLRFSHGFRALEFRQRKAEGEDGDEMEFNGFDITKFEIMEASLVSVPSNTDAEMELWSSGKLHSDFFKAKAKATWDKRTVQVKGVTLEDEADQEATPEASAEATEHKADNAAENNTQATQTHAGEPPQAASATITLAAGTTQAKDTDGAAATDGGSTDEPKSTTPEATKQKLTKRNLNRLQDVVDDLKEMMDREDFTRAGKAQCEKCIKTCEDIMKEGVTDDETDDAAGDAGKAAKHATDVDSRAPTITWPEIHARAICGTQEQRAELAKSLSIMESVDQADRQVALYRTVTGQQQKTGTR